VAEHERLLAVYVPARHIGDQPPRKSTIHIKIHTNISHAEQFSEIETKASDPFTDERCKHFGHEAGVITLLLGNSETVRSFYISFLISDPPAVMHKYAERPQSVEKERWIRSCSE
jgi:hypothetical protein